MRKPIGLLTFATAVVAFAGLGVDTTHAQSLVAPEIQNGINRVSVAPVFTFSSVDYHLDGGGGTSVDRTILGASASYGLLPELDLYGELGYTVKAELDDGGDDDGIIVGTGLRGTMWKQDRLTLMGLAGVRVINESYGGGVDGSEFEIPLTLLLKGKVRPEFNLYGGLDAFPYSNGRIDFDRGHRDIERQDKLGLRVGADYQLKNGISLNAECVLVTEDAFNFRVSFPL